MPQLTWLGDQEAKRTARKVPYRLLDPVEQVGDPAAGNLLIQGDNLEARKALLPLCRTGEMHFHRSAVQHKECV